MADHSSIYKSKSGRHFGKIDHQDEEKEEKIRMRRNKRQTGYMSNRVIEATPAKPTKAASAKGIVAIATMADSQIVHEEENTQPSISNISRQKAYRERFRQYLLAKASKKNKKATVKPFVSAVATGRFVDTTKSSQQNVSNDKQNDEKKELIVPSTPEPVPLKQRFSPINTRSKKFKLMSPSQLPTPKRSASKKKQNKQLKKPDVSVPPKKILQQPTIKPKTFIGTKKVEVKSKGPINSVKTKKEPELPKKNLNLPKLFVQPPAPIVPKRKVMKKPVVAKKDLLQIPGTNKVNGRFKTPTEMSEIKPSKDFITSTISRTNKPSSIAGKLMKTSINMFDESISPIEDLTPQRKMTANSTTIATPNNMKRRDSFFVSPFVTIKRSIQTDSNTVLDASTSPKNLIESNEKSQKNDESVSTPNKSQTETACLNYVSPYVTISRGARGSNRKEREARDSKYTLDSRKSIDLNESIKDRQNKEAAAYFHLQVQREIDRFKDLIDKWKKYEAENSVPSEYVDLIHVAIGQTNLLTSSKFKQFTKLVDECVSGQSEQTVKAEDLEGFWSMVYLQVENCNARFEKIEKLKANNWIDPELNVVEEKIEPKEKKIKASNAMVAKKKPAKTRCNRALADMLKQAREKYTASKENTNQMQQGNDIVIFGNNSFKNSPRNVTPSKSVWVVEDVKKTPARSILKTPGSMRKQRLTIRFKTSPQVQLFNTEEK